ncbi:MAG: DUF4255 domain-containing protein [Egibacteraceae bacterium]
MAGFRSIAAVGKSIEMVLNAAYAAEEPIDTGPTRAKLIQTEDLDAVTTTLMRPALSIFLYRVDFNKAMRASWSATGNTDGRAHLPLDLHYLLTAWADNAEHEHRVIGRSMQALEQLGALSGPLLYPDGEWLPGESVQLYLEDMATDDLMRTFDSLMAGFRLSIPYIARVVVVSSDETVPVPHVSTLISGLRPSVAASGAARGTR